MGNRSVIVIVENLDNIKTLMNETQELINALEKNVNKLSKMGIKFQVKEKPKSWF